MLEVLQRTKHTAQLQFLPYVFNMKNISEFQQQLNPLLNQTSSSGSSNKGNNNVSSGDAIVIPISADATKPFVIIGLHTCGNLALNVIDLFLHSNAKAMIGVGCCYHSLVDGTSSIHNIIAQRRKSNTC